MKILGRLITPSLAFPGEVREFIKVDFDERGGSPHDKIRKLRALISDGAQDPRINELASSLVRGQPDRDDAAEAATLLEYVQNHVRYTEEGTETFRSAAYTAEKGFGDCDDAVVLYCALCESIGIPTRLSIISKRTGLLRHEPLHVYALVGLPHRNPTDWLPAEPTIHVPLGWDPVEYAAAHADKL